MIDFSASPATLGYFYQARFTLLNLLQAEADAEMSFERFDDVAFEEARTPTQLLHTKHHVSLTASLTNSNVVADLSSQCQVISTDHADLADSRLQSAVVERWRGGLALVPLSWVASQ